MKPKVKQIILSEKDANTFSSNACAAGHYENPLCTHGLPPGGAEDLDEKHSTKLYTPSEKKSEFDYERKARYLKAAELLNTWINQPGDYDGRVYALLEDSRSAQSIEPNTTQFLNRQILELREQIAALTAELEALRAQSADSLVGTLYDRMDHYEQALRKLANGQSCGCAEIAKAALSQHDSKANEVTALVPDDTNSAKSLAAPTTRTEDEKEMSEQ